MKRSKRLRNISRVDYARRSWHGWLVRVMRNGERFQKFFSDYAHGSKSGSLRQAQSYRDNLLRLYPLPPHGNLLNRMTVRNTSGHPGVSKTGSWRKGHYYAAWQAAWTLPNGQRMTKKFVFSPTGRTELAAKRLAIKARREGLLMIEAALQRKAEKRQAGRTKGPVSKAGKARKAARKK